MKKGIIFSIAYYPLVGGAEIAVKEITDRLGRPALGWDMITLKFDKKSSPVEKIGNINVYRIRGPKLLFPFLAFLKAQKLHKKNSYDLIWSIMAAYAGFAALFFKITHPKIPYLLTLQEGDPIEYVKKKVRFVYPLFSKIFSKADFIQAISYYLADWAKEMGAKGPIEIVPNAADTKHFSQEYSEKELYELKTKLGKAPDDKYIITTSRLVPKNGIGDVIEALQYLPENVKFLILGTGPLKEELKLQATSYKLKAKTMFLGHIDHKEMPKYLKISDVFIRPSLSEGMGNSFIEAMAAGIPVIATPVGGVIDFLKDGETGLFCNVRDPRSIAEKIQIIIANKELREKIVTNAKKMVFEKYDWNLIAEKMRNIFIKLTQ